MNPHNPHNTAQLTALGLLHRDRSFFPTARQRELLNDLTSAPNPGLALLGYGGAMGGGKTRAIVELALDAALAYPNNNVLVARQHYSDLSATTMREFFAACPPELIRRRQQSPTHLVELALPDWPALATCGLGGPSNCSGSFAAGVRRPKLCHGLEGPGGIGLPHPGSPRESRAPEAIAKIQGGATPLPAKNTLAASSHPLIA